MEDISKKAYDDELNKSQEEIHKAPRKYIPVPKLRETEEQIKRRKENKEEERKL